MAMQMACTLKGFSSPFLRESNGKISSSRSAIPVMSLCSPLIMNGISSSSSCQLMQSSRIFILQATCPRILERIGVLVGVRAVWCTWPCQHSWTSYGAAGNGKGKVRACYSAIYSFGDSLADTGNLLAAAAGDRAGNLPYGETYFGKATGRFKFSVPQSWMVGEKQLFELLVGDNESITSR